MVLSTSNNVSYLWFLLLAASHGHTEFIVLYILCYSKVGEAKSCDFFFFPVLVNKIFKVWNAEGGCLVHHQTNYSLVNDVKTNHFKSKIIFLNMWFVSLLVCCDMSHLMSPHLPETMSAVLGRSASVTASQHLCQTLSGDSSPDLLLQRHPHAPLLLLPPMLLQVLCCIVASWNTLEAPDSLSSHHSLHREMSRVPPALWGSPPHPGLYF